MQQLTHEQLLQRVTEIVRELAEDDSLVLYDQSTPESVAWWDSMFHLRLFLAIESEFGLRFETSEITKPTSIGDMVELIRSKLN